METNSDHFSRTTTTNTEASNGTATGTLSRKIAILSSAGTNTKQLLHQQVMSANKKFIL